MTNRYVFFFFNDTATTEIYTLSLHDALPIYIYRREIDRVMGLCGVSRIEDIGPDLLFTRRDQSTSRNRDRKSTRLNSSHANISYAVFCLKKKKQTITFIPYS